MKVQAYKVPKKYLNTNKMLNFSDLSEGSTKIIPVKIRNVGSYGYHVAEDVKGNVYLINDDEVLNKKLNSRNLEVCETKYMLDSLGRELIKKANENKLNSEKGENDE